WRDMVDNLIGKKFTAATGVPVEYIAGGTIDRLNKEKLAKGNPESDITFTTSHVGWLYANDGLYETLDLKKVPNASKLVEQAKISPYHIGTWAYVYTIGYRPDLLKGVAFESWADLWKPEIKGKLAAPDFDPSHPIVVSAILSGGDASTWEKGQAKLKELKPNFKAFYTNDANSQQLIANGETPVQVISSMNAHHTAGEGVPIQLVIPKEGAVRAIVRSGRAAVRPFLRLFVAPAVLCVLGFAAALAAVMQYRLRAYVPGSLEAGGFTLANFAALIRPLYARVFLDTVWICFLTAS